MLYPFGSHFKDLSAEISPVFSFLVFLKFRSINVSDTKIFVHFNFWTKSLSEIKPVRNYLFLMLYGLMFVKQKIPLKEVSMGSSCVDIKGSYR